VPGAVIDCIVVKHVTQEDEKRDPPSKFSGYRGSTR